MGLQKDKHVTRNSCPVKHKVKTKFEIDKYVNVKNNTLDKFKRKWATNGNLLLNIYFFLSVRNHILLWLRKSL